MARHPRLCGALRLRQLRDRAAQAGLRLLLRTNIDARLDGVRLGLPLLDAPHWTECSHGRSPHHPARGPGSRHENVPEAHLREPRRLLRRVRAIGHPVERADDPVPEQPGRRGAGEVLRLRVAARDGAVRDGRFHTRPQPLLVGIHRAPNSGLHAACARIDRAAVHQPIKARVRAPGIRRFVEFKRPVTDVAIYRHCNPND
mmetsp:Transcript_100233/g.283837  ORF Transcript_100233/g.283837 Transcript_100233/m.283837 type:complete len:201 (-) Transcript_100233:26-628(-)